MVILGGKWKGKCEQDHTHDNIRITSSYFDKKSGGEKIMIDKGEQLEFHKFVLIT
jgi:hypothetical protein